jgi:hypothetical protein
MWLVLRGEARLISVMFAGHGVKLDVLVLSRDWAELRRPPFLGDSQA